MTAYALCIGVDDYKKPLARLRCARKDAADLARLMRERLGFEAAVLDAAPGGRLTADDVYDAIDGIAERLRQGDSFVFSFAGHGAVEGDDQHFYLAGVRQALLGADPRAAPGVLSWATLRAHTAGERWQGVQRVFIIDSCRAPLTSDRSLAEPVPVFDGRVLLGRNLIGGNRAKRLASQRPDEPPFTLLNACSEKQKAYEMPDGHNSVFAAALMEELVEELADSTGGRWRIDADFAAALQGRVDTVRRTAGLDDPRFAQAPEWNGTAVVIELPARASTAGGSSTGTTSPGRGGLDDAELDARLWRIACLKNTVAAFEDYIRNAPRGAAHLDGAADRIEELLAHEQDATLWSQAQAGQPDGLHEQLDWYRGALARLRSKQARADCEQRIAALERQIAAARPLPGQVLKDSDLSPELVVLPRGSFTMGSPASEPERDADEGPQRVVTIGYNLAVGRYEVTQREWTAVMGSNPSYFKGCDDCPVETVSWDDAQKYLAELNRRTGGKFGYRLLSEAEWEYMARGVTRADAPSTAFWWGNEIDPSLANYDGNYAYNNGPKGQYRKKTTPVGTFKANPFGIYDVHGNVWEWVQDVWHGDYAGAPSDGTAWTTSGDQTRRVLRGGSWNNYPGILRAAIRDWYGAGSRISGTGLRIARTLP
jgi:formylglycine-generating enzyme required for sulfatase activity